jgi:hypothetical protein
LLNDSFWPGQVKDNPNLGAVNLSFSCSPRPRLDARADRPVLADAGFTLIVQEPALRNLAALRQTPAYWGFSETPFAAMCNHQRQAAFRQHK